MAIAMLSGPNPVLDVQLIVLTVARVDQLFFLLLFMLGVNAPRQSNLSLHLRLVILVSCS